MNRLAITDTDLPEDFEVDLWGHVFTLLPVTRTRQLRLLELDREYKAIDEDAEDASDHAARVLGDVLDVQLKPKSKQSKTAAELVKARWENDEVTSAQLLAFTRNLADAQRPT